MLRRILFSPTAETGGNGSAKADQADIVSQNAKLTQDLATANASIVTLTAERDNAKTEASTANAKVAVITAERDAEKVKVSTANASIVTLTAERDTLKTENDKLKAEKTSVDTAAAKQVASVGIVTQAATSKPGEQAKQPTLTEKVLAAQGVKSLAESETKYRERLAANPGL